MSIRINNDKLEISSPDLDLNFLNRETFSFKNFNINTEISDPDNDPFAIFSFVNISSHINKIKDNFVNTGLINLQNQKLNVLSCSSINLFNDKRKFLIQKEMLDNRFQEFINYEEKLKKDKIQNIFLDQVEIVSKNYLEFYEKINYVTTNLTIKENNIGNKIIDFYRGKAYNGFGNIIDWVNKPLNLDYDSLNINNINKNFSLSFIEKEALYDFNQYINDKYSQEKFITNNLLINTTFNERNQSNDYLIDNVEIIGQNTLSLAKSLFVPTNAGFIYSRDTENKYYKYLTKLNKEFSLSSLKSYPIFKDNKLIPDVLDIAGDNSYRNFIFSDFSFDISMFIDTNKIANLKNRNSTQNLNVLNIFENWSIDEINNLIQFSDTSEVLNNSYLKNFQFGPTEQPSWIATKLSRLNCFGSPIKFSFVENNAQNVFENESPVTSDDKNDRRKFFKFKNDNPISFNSLVSGIDVPDTFLNVVCLLNNIKRQLILNENINIDFITNFAKKSQTISSPAIIGSTKENCIFNVNSYEENIFYSSGNYFFNRLTENLSIDNIDIKATQNTLEEGLDINKGYIESSYENLKNLVSFYYPDNILKNNFEFFKKMLSDFTNKRLQKLIENFHYTRDFLYPLILMSKNKDTLALSRIIFAKTLSNLNQIKLEESLFDNDDFNLIINYEGEESDLLNLPMKGITFFNMVDNLNNPSREKDFSFNLNVNPYGTFISLGSFRNTPKVLQGTTEEFADSNATEGASGTLGYTSIDVILANGGWESYVDKPRWNKILKDAYMRSLEGINSNDWDFIDEDAENYIPESDFVNIVAERNEEAALKEDKYVRGDGDPAYNFSATLEAWKWKKRNPRSGRKIREVAAFIQLAREINNEADRAILQAGSTLDLGSFGADIVNSLKEQAEFIRTNVSVTDSRWNHIHRPDVFSTQVLPSNFNAKIPGIIFEKYDNKAREFLQSSDEIKSKYYNSKKIKINQVRSWFIHSQNKNSVLEDLIFNEKRFRKEIFLSLDSSNIFSNMIDTISLIIKYVFKESDIEKIRNQEDIFSFIKNNYNMTSIINQFIESYYVLSNSFFQKSFYLAVFNKILANPEAEESEEVFIARDFMNLVDKYNLKDSFKETLDHYKKILLDLVTSEEIQYDFCKKHLDQNDVYNLFNPESSEDRTQFWTNNDYKQIFHLNEFKFLKLLNMFKKEDLTKSSYFENLNIYLKDTLENNDTFIKELKENIEDIEEGLVSVIDKTNINEFALSSKSLNMFLKDYYNESIKHSYINQKIKELKNENKENQINFTNDVIYEYFKKKNEYLDLILDSPVDQQKDIICIGLPYDRLQESDLNTIFKISISIVDHVRPDFSCIEREFYFSPMFSTNLKLKNNFVINDEISFSNNNNEEKILFFNRNKISLKDKSSLVTQDEVIQIVSSLIMSGERDKELIAKRMFYNYLISKKYELIMTEINSHPRRSKLFTSTVYDLDIVGNFIKNTMLNLDENKLISIFNEDKLGFISNVNPINQNLNETIYDYEEKDLDNNTKIYSFMKNINQITDFSDLRECNEKKELYDYYFIEISPDDFHFKLGHSITSENVETDYAGIYSTVEFRDLDQEKYSDYLIKGYADDHSFLIKSRNGSDQNNSYNYIIKVEEIR